MAIIKADCYGHGAVVMMEYMMKYGLKHFGVATLTAPFCITTWLFLLPLLKFDEQHPDHSQWHHRS